MPTITPQKKIEIMRKYEANPSSAVLMIMEELRKEMSALVAEKMDEMRKDPEGYVRKKMDNLEGEFKDRMSKLLKTAEVEMSNTLEKSIFKDLVKPATEEAKKIADASMREFKSDAALKIDRAVSSMENIFNKLFSEARTELAKSKSESKESFKKEFIRFADQMEEVLRDHEAEMKSNVENLRGPKGKDADPKLVKEMVLAEIPKPKDGSPDKPQEIADKLNTLTEKVEMSLIKGLRKTIENLMASIREKKGGGGQGGGGVGNFQHETKNLTSSTTTVNTTYNVGGAGFAIWAFYQGQQIQRGTGYTISGKTITLLFTPVDGTFLDIIYIRT